jgi:hypothetical protein
MLPAVDVFSSISGATKTEPSLLLPQADKKLDIASTERTLESTWGSAPALPKSQKPHAEAAPTADSWMATASLVIQLATAAPNLCNFCNVYRATGSPQAGLIADKGLLLLSSYNNIRTAITRRLDDLQDQSQMQATGHPSAQEVVEIQNVLQQLQTSRQHVDARQGGSESSSRTCNRAIEACSRRYPTWCLAGRMSCRNTWMSLRHTFVSWSSSR